MYRYKKIMEELTDSEISNTAITVLDLQHSGKIDIHHADLALKALTFVSIARKRHNFFRSIVIGVVSLILGMITYRVFAGF